MAVKQKVNKRECKIRLTDDISLRIDPHITIPAGTTGILLTGHHDGDDKGLVPVRFETYKIWVAKEHLEYL